jgi:hypothetical protein
MIHESPARLHIPRIHGHISFWHLTRIIAYLAGIVVCSTVILKAIP